MWVIVRSPTWDTSPDNVVFYSVQWAEISIGDIPSVRVWGDGYIVWTHYDDQRRRHVRTDYLSYAEMDQITNDLIDAGFFRGYRYPFSALWSYPSALCVNLRDVLQCGIQIDTQQSKLDEIFQSLRFGAGKAGTEFTPTTGQLIAIPIASTEYRDREGQVKYQWQDEIFGYRLSEIESYRPDGIVTGEELAYAWEIANDALPLAESNGQVYWVAVLIPTRP